MCSIIYLTFSSSNFMYSTSMLAEMVLRNVNPILTQNSLHMHTPMAVCTYTHTEILLNATYLRL
jgi:hypothetical protein